MARGFVTGALWGCIVMGAGLVVLSQLAPVQQAAQTAVPKVANDAAVAPPKPAPAAPVIDSVTATALPDVVQAPVVSDKAELPKAAEPAPVMTDTPQAPAQDVAEAPATAVPAPVADQVADAAPGLAPDQKSGAEAAVPPAMTPAPTVAIPVAPNTKAVDGAKPVPEVAAVVPAPVVVAQPETPQLDVGTGMAAAAPTAPLPDLPAVPEAPPTLAGLEPALTAPGSEVAPVAPLPPEPEGAKDALLAPTLQPGQAEPAHLPQIAPADEPAMAAVLPIAVPVPEVETPPKESPATTIEAQVPTLPPVKPLTDKVPKGIGQAPGVEVGLLPHIGEIPIVEAPVADLRPVVRFAREFDAGAGKPLFVILLQDVGSAGMARDALAKLPFPVSFVVDPLASDAKAAALAYRAAGQEVVTLANGIPAGAEASDLAETFQTLTAILPESVAVIDQDLGGFQDNRPLAGLVLPILQDEGRGLVTYDRGLNAADQIARRDGVPSAVIFRRLDGENETKATIRRYLDRAAFKAAQEGRVVVIGDTRADTVAAILEWTVEGRASSVTLAPLTAVLGR